MSLQPPGHKSARIEELLDTLECPVCLDTADTAPVYQCPEGHLICKVRTSQSDTLAVFCHDILNRIAMARWLSVLSVAMLS